MAELFHANPGLYQTFRAIRIPDRMVKTACEEANCGDWRNGWVSAFDESTAQGKYFANYVRYKSGRTFTESKSGAGLTVFRFDPHQRCFREHETQGGFLLVQAGDVNSNLGLIREHTRAADWQEDFQENQGRLADEQARG